eukprot:6204833-Pleurochrysis_carterae.AAC.1
MTTTRLRNSRYADAQGTNVSTAGDAISLEGTPPEQHEGMEAQQEPEGGGDTYQREQESTVLADQVSKWEIRGKEARKQ